MNQILIHIGYHKTATTWLQRELFVESNTLFEPLSRWKNRKSTLGFQFVYGEDGYLLSPFDNNAANIRKEFLYLLKDKKDIENKVLVISNERLCGHYRSGGFDSKVIAQRLYSVFPKAKIFISIREQISYILSYYFQYLSMGGVWSLQQYLNNRSHKVPSFSPHFQQYNALIEEYYNLFGKENVLVLPYELFQNEPRVYIERIGNFLGKKIEIDEARFQVRHNIKTNPYVLYRFRWLNWFRFRNSNNHYSTWSNRYTKFLAKKCYNLLNKIVPESWNEQVKQQLQAEIEEWNGDRYLAANQALSELIEIDLSKYDYH